MYHVFVDFEMTYGGSRGCNTGIHTKEIIEIGAVKLNDKFETVGMFSLNVKPQYTLTLSKKCAKLTGIREEDLAKAPLLDEALILFEDWLGTEDVKLYSWGDNDKKQLESECLAKGLYNKMPAYYRRWLNFQNIFMRVYGFHKRIKLINAIEIMGMDFEGKEHKAIYDSLNTAKLMILMKDKERHEKKKEQEQLKRIYNNNQPIVSNIGELIGDKLAGLVLAS